ncbi:MAG: hypothetical protein ACYTGW_21530 [Planctomycetota bacterium]
MTTHTPPPQRADLPAWLWLWFPPLILVAHGVTRAISYETWTVWMKSEFGVVEIGTFALLLIAVVLGVMVLLRRKQVDSPLFGPWVLLLTLGCFYFAAEEVSWGYHWGWQLFGEEFSRQLQEHNDQGETNLHNLPGLLGGILDNLPRFLLSFAALGGGILVPLWGKYKRPVTWPTPWIWPTMACLPVSVLVWVIRIPRRVFRWLDHPEQYRREWRSGETMEYLLAVFLMLYLASLLWRLRKDQLTGATGAASTSVRTGP